MLRSDDPCAIARTFTPALRERREHLRGDARRARHAVADDRQDAAAGRDVHVLDLPLLELAAERVPHDGRGPLGLGLRDRETDRMLGARLRDEDDRDAVLAQRAEQALRGAGHADHAGALDVDQRHAVDAGDALDRMVRRRARRRSAFPPFSGANVFRIQIGISFVTAGAIVCG